MSDDPICVDGHRFSQRLERFGPGTWYAIENHPERLGRVVPARLGGATLEQVLAAAPAASALDHPRIIRFHGARLLPGRPAHLALVTDTYDDIRSIERVLLPRAPMREIEVLHILRELVDGLDAIAGRPHAHGWLTPTRIFLDEDSHIVLTNPWVGWVEDCLQQARSTDTTDWQYTWVAPECTATPGSADVVSDLFVACAIGYALVTGATPFDSDTVLGLGTGLLPTTPDPRSANPSVSAGFAELLMTGLDLDRRGRFQDPASLRAAIDGVLGRRSQVVERAGAGADIAVPPPTAPRSAASAPPAPTAAPLATARPPAPAPTPAGGGGGGAPPLRSIAIEDASAPDARSTSATGRPGVGAGARRRNSDALGAPRRGRERSGRPPLGLLVGIGLPVLGLLGLLAWVIVDGGGDQLQSGTAPTMAETARPEERPATRSEPAPRVRTGPFGLSPPPPERDEAAAPVVVDGPAPAGDPLEPVPRATRAEDDTRPSTPRAEVVELDGVHLSAVASTRRYRLTRAERGARPYTDRDYTIRELPDRFAGGVLVQVADEDKSRTSTPGETTIALELERPATVIVVRPEEIREMPWLAGWTRLEDRIQVRQNPGWCALYARNFPAGSVALQANDAAGNASSHYFVLVVARDQQDPTAVLGADATDPPPATDPAIGADEAPPSEPTAADPVVVTSAVAAGDDDDAEEQPDGAAAPAPNLTTIRARHAELLAARALRPEVIAATPTRARSLLATLAPHWREVFGEVLTAHDALRAELAQHPDLSAESPVITLRSGQSAAVVAADADGLEVRLGSGSGTGRVGWNLLTFEQTLDLWATVHWRQRDDQRYLLCRALLGPVPTDLVTQRTAMVELQRELDPELPAQSEEILLLAEDAELQPAADGNDHWELVAADGDILGSRVWRSSDMNRGAGNEESHRLPSEESSLRYRFHALGGVPYHMRIRGRRTREGWAHDCVAVVFEGAATVQGEPRLGPLAPELSPRAASFNGWEHLAGWRWLEARVNRKNGQTIRSGHTEVVFAQTGWYHLRLHSLQGPLEIDAVWLSTGHPKLPHDAYVPDELR